MDTTRICDIENGCFFLLNNDYYIKLNHECMNLRTRKWEDLYEDIHCRPIDTESIFEKFNYRLNT